MVKSNTGEKVGNKNRNPFHSKNPKGHNRTEERFVWGRFNMGEPLLPRPWGGGPIPSRLRYLEEGGRNDGVGRNWGSICGGEVN